ncbi:hypothetical protein C8R46DRAFT_1035284 [Mycena filopes]|nr:hypothetical protein C8R46DRAFT_1035284 [Mycena filopes]
MFVDPHTVRMAPARAVLTSVNHGPSITSAGLSLPSVYPTEEVINRFWRRVAELTTRYHDVQRKWIDGEEIRLWNSQNKDPCSKCRNSKSGKLCILDEDQPSCRTCRQNKVGCDRKRLFVFDMTKSEFFPVYEQFLEVFKNTGAGRFRRYNKAAEDHLPKRAVGQLVKGDIVHS